MNKLLRLDELSIEDQDALNFLADKQVMMTERTIDWARINTGSWNRAGLQEMSQTILHTLSELEATTKLVDLPPIKKINQKAEATEFHTGPIIHAAARPNAPIQIILTGHYDTVFPKGTFEDITDLGGGKLNGPGLADMKGGIVVMLEALKAFEASGLKSKLGYRIVLTPDEETGNFASADFLGTAAKEAHIGLTFEPAMESGAMSGARKGSAIFDIIFKGKASHAGRNPEDGRSAIMAAAEFCIAVEKLEGQRDGVTFNIGKIDGGGPNNIVPDVAIVRMGTRAPDAKSADWAVKALSDIFETVLQRDGISGEMNGGFYRPPKPKNKAQRTLFEAAHKTGQALNLELTFHDTGGVCEGNNVFAAGTPNIDTLGVRGGRIHSSDEFVIVDSFTERAGLTALILNRIADGRIDAAHIKSLMKDA